MTQTPVQSKCSVIFSNGIGGLPKIDVQTPRSEGEIYLHGAHVTKFQRKGEAPLLFLSEKSRFERGQPIRGGVPVIFPWFGAREGKPMHGFARTQTWELKEISFRDETVALHLNLLESPEAAEYPKFVAQYFVTVGETLSLELRITNHAVENLSLENCLHTYFAIGDINEIKLTGLKGKEYLDKLENFARKNESGEEIKFSGETDRVYLNTTSAVEIHDFKLGRKIFVEKEGSSSTVVWNPWMAKAKTMADFGDEEYLQMVCVESGNVSENKLILPPGKTSSLKVNLRSEPIRERGTN